MRRLALLRAPTAFALRRVRARPFSMLTIVLALAGAVALLGWSSLDAALSQEDSVQRQLAARGPGARSLRVVYFMLPLESDYRGPTVAGAFAEFAAVTEPVRRVRISHSIEPGRPRGTRLVVAREPRTDVSLTDGRLPAACGGGTCEVVALGGRERVGAVLRVGGLRAVVVGKGTLDPALVPDRSELGDRPLLVRSLTKRLAPLFLRSGSTVVTTAALDPHRVRGYALADLNERLRIAFTRLGRGDPLVRPAGPFALLHDLEHRGAVARERLLLVAGEGAALILAFAAFLAVARRREARAAEDQLAVLGASRGQLWTARIVEVVAPTLAGTVLALAGLWIAALAVASHRGFGHGLVGAALPPATMLAIVALALVADVLLVASLAPPRGGPRGVGALELAAVSALAVVAWQATSTGGLDPDRVASSGGDPVLLLVPALAFFATGVLILRLLPPTLRACARLARGAPFGLRLALLTVARNPHEAAAATTFLAVALGASLFSLDYRATLDRQARDQASFTAGARWRVSGEVTPLTRFASVSAERPTPVLRLDGTVDQEALAGQLQVRVLALPARRVEDLRGWRDGFSTLSRAEIARALRPRPVRLRGPAIARDADAIRVWVRARTDYPRRIVLHLLLPGQGFAHLTLGEASPRWRLLRLPVGPALHGAELIGVEFQPTYVPISFKYDPEGVVQLGPLEQRHAGGGWAPLAALDGWTPSVAPTGTAGILTAATFGRGPVRHGVEFELAGTFQPLVHPTFGLPDPRPGFVIGDVPALAAAPVAGAAVDRLLVLDVAGRQVPVRVVGSAKLFPTVVDRPGSFLVMDYDTLFAALNADEPGLVVPSEAWFFKPQAPRFASALARRPFRSARVVGVEPLRHQLASDPLAAGTRAVLGVTGIAAALLGVLGLLLATRSMLASERLQLAEYEALGVPARSLRRGAQARLVALSAFGIVAGLGGALLSGRLIGAFVAVTGTGRRPLPPILPTVSWALVAAVVATGAVAALAAAALLTRRALRAATGARLRA